VLCMLWGGGRLMFTPLERFGDVVGHADVNGMVDVVPVNMLPHLQSTGPISGDGVFLLQDID
jgi:hypothetical protein